MTSKLLQASDIRKFFQNGLTVGIGGGAMAMNPVSLIKELIKSKINSLHVVPAPIGGYGVDLLIAAGLVKKVEFAQMSFEEFSMAPPAFRAGVQGGKVKPKDHTWPGLLSGLQAGAIGIPFIPLRGVIGTDYLEVNDDFKVIENPYNEKEDIALAPAITPDLVLAHAFAGDEEGNVRINPNLDDALLIKAGKKVFVSVEKIVSSAELKDMSRGNFISGIHIDGIIEAPGGAQPTSCGDYYDVEDKEIHKYIHSHKENRVAEYMEELLKGGEK